MLRINKRIVMGFSVTLLLSGCAAYLTQQMDDRYGTAQPQDRLVASDSRDAQFYQQQVKPIIDNRCVVCHACYDAPCQLKLNSPEGIDRGLNPEKVYNSARLLAADPSRLFVDANTTQQWRERDFQPVLNERSQSPDHNLAAGLLYRSLELKRQHPNPTSDRLPDSFDFSLDRNQQCSTIESYDAFAKNYPQWGMPYGLPGLQDHEFERLRRWLEGGARMPSPGPLAAELTAQLDHWEQWLNKDGLKQQLVSRYIYEHLYIFSLYFNQPSAQQYFKLIRSKTPPGTAIEAIVSRRPYDDPEVDRVYYRLQPQRSTAVAKTHIPYAMDANRMARWQTLFFDPPYQVDRLPGYAPDVASNPFLAYEQIPSQARYRFMLDEAQSTIMAFIKGPVCRGQVAVNVINDHFWVFFSDPDIHTQATSQFLADNSHLLALPAESSSNLPPISNWIRYSKLQGGFLEAKTKRFNEALAAGTKLDQQLIWDGDGSNSNAALTILRHFDNASVVQGLVGEPPKTAWVIDYSLLERIHYLLVAGYDVFGNLGHQLVTRLYMDFLRMEGEFNFLALLPSETRKTERNHWYRDSGPSIQEHLYGKYTELHAEPAISYVSDSPKAELYQLLKARLGPVLEQSYRLESSALSVDSVDLLRRLEQMRGQGLALLPQVSVLLIELKDGTQEVVTLVHNSAHANISSLLNESGFLLPEEDSLTVVRGVLGDYPNAFVSIRESQLIELANQLVSMQTENDYRLMMSRYGVRRSDPRFWQVSDQIRDHYRLERPISSALLDYNRLENR
ncbi:MAG: fatty acid cis/trans isomerase [Halopseudomonas sp.]